RRPYSQTANLARQTAKPSKRANSGTNLLEFNNRRSAMMKKTASLILSLLLLLINFCLFAVPKAAYGQSAAELRGTVLDETKGVIVAGPVTLDDGQGNKYTTQTDDRGHYSFAGVKPGKYTLRVEVEGFAKFADEVDLSTRRAAPLDIVLKAAISNQQVD